MSEKSPEPSDAPKQGAQSPKVSSNSPNKRKSPEKNNVVKSKKRVTINDQVEVKTDDVFLNGFYYYYFFLIFQSLSFKIVIFSHKSIKIGRRPRSSSRRDARNACDPAESTQKAETSTRRQRQEAKAQRRGRSRTRRATAC